LPRLLSSCSCAHLDLLSFTTRRSSDLLGNAGLSDALANVIQLTADKGLFAASIVMGFIAAFLSSIMNNMPTVMIDALSIASIMTDRKSTRLNSSHVSLSYDVFCLKNKN